MIRKNAKTWVRTVEMERNKRPTRRVRRRSNRVKIAAQGTGKNMDRTRC